MSDSELLPLIVTGARDSGTIDHSEQEMVKGVLKLQDWRVCGFGSRNPNSTKLGRERRGKKKENVTEKACDLRQYKVRLKYIFDTKSENRDISLQNLIC